MRLSLLIFFFIVQSLGVSGQALKGMVVDGETQKPLGHVSIVNKETLQTVYTDENGRFTINAENGHMLSIYISGYGIQQLVATPDFEMSVYLFPLTVKLHDFVLHDYTPFQRDSIEMTTLYSKELNTRSVKTGFSSANGGGVTGLIGGPVQKMSRSYKRNKRFKENFKNDMEQKYIDTRYTPALVATLTGLRDDTLVEFMNSYPMDYTFARAATDLEIKMWIRSNYKDYLHKKNTEPNESKRK